MVALLNMKFSTMSVTIITTFLLTLLMKKQELMLRGLKTWLPRNPSVEVIAELGLQYHTTTDTR